MTPFDCETLGGGFPRQPVNTLSSVVFLVAAIVLWRRGRRVAAAAAALVGVGSIAFHGVPSLPSSWLHDVGLYAAIAIASVEVWRRWAAGHFPMLALSIFGGGVVIWALARTGGPLCSPDSLLQGHALWHGLSAAALVTLFAARDRG